MAKAGKNEIDAQLDALRRLARGVVQSSKGVRPISVKDMRALRQQQRRTVSAIDAEIDQLKRLRRSVRRARIPDGMVERLTP
jgi:hypothetical protein